MGGAIEGRILANQKILIINFLIMKKYFGFVAFALLTVVMAMSVASCDKDKEAL